MFRITLTILVAMLDVIPGGQAYLRQLQPRDSVLIADQVEYGFRLDGVKDGTVLALPDLSKASNDTLTLVRGWQVDTLKTQGRRKSGNVSRDLKASIVLTPFEEGTYVLPDIPLQRTTGDLTDTLVFKGMELDVKTMPVDTATFQIHDIKGQMRYPVTFRELAPWISGGWFLVALAILAVCLIKLHRESAEGGESSSREPAYIVALRKLDKFRSDKYWAPEKQKTFYSGITDTLKNYIDDRFGVDAPEMTTAELFSALESEKDITPELYNEMRELFERADFVKFAKYTASDEDNAKALPLAVRFVTSTYQTELEEEQKENVL